MTTDAPIWPKRQRQDEFFARLEALMSEYPEITNVMSRQYALDPADSMWESTNDQPGYDPSSPVMVTGIVLIVTSTNTEGWEDMTVSEPYQQSIYMTHGIIGEALSITGRSYS